MIFRSNKYFSMINLLTQDGDVIELAQVSDIRYGGTPKVNNTTICLRYPKGLYNIQLTFYTY